MLMREMTVADMAERVGNNSTKPAFPHGAQPSAVTFACRDGFKQGAVLAAPGYRGFGNRQVPVHSGMLVEPQIVERSGW
jgi:hypothetical protein